MLYRHLVRRHPEAEGGEAGELDLAVADVGLEDEARGGAGGEVEERRRHVLCGRERFALRTAGIEDKVVASLSFHFQ